MYGQLMASSLSIVGRLSSYWSVHYRRFYCNYYGEKIIISSNIDYIDNAFDGASLWPTDSQWTNS